MRHNIPFLRTWCRHPVQTLRRDRWTKVFLTEVAAILKDELGMIGIEFESAVQNMFDGEFLRSTELLLSLYARANAAEAILSDRLVVVGDAHSTQRPGQHVLRLTASPSVGEMQTLSIGFEVLTAARPCGMASVDIATKHAELLLLGLADPYSSERIASTNGYPGYALTLRSLGEVASYLWLLCKWSYRRLEGYAAFSRAPAHLVGNEPIDIPMFEIGKFYEKHFGLANIRVL